MEEEASDAAFEGARLPKVLQLIQAREKAERKNARARMQGMPPSFCWRLCSPAGS